MAVLPGLLFVAANISRVDGDIVDESLPYVHLYDDPSSKLEVIVNQGDGQAFAALAQDPLLRRPEVFRAGLDEAAYRAQRPLLGWLTWGLSGGQASLVPLVLLVLAVVGYVALGAALAAWLTRRGAAPWGALLVLVTPGALVTLDWTGPEALATAATLAGAMLWPSERRALAVGLLLGAGLGRETMLVVPLALLGHDLLVRRRPVRSVLALLVPFAGYALWVLVLWLRLDALPTGAGSGRLGLPFSGLVQGMDSWHSDDAVCAGLYLFIGVVGALTGRRDRAGWVAGAYVLASLLLGSDVWKRQEDFGRVLLPMMAFGTVALLSAVQAARSGAPEGAGGPSPLTAGAAS